MKNGINVNRDVNSSFYAYKIIYMYEGLKIEGVV